jgi:PhzF family phenazine biosynthesis protein
MRLLIVDAFTDRPFSGNPAAVCLLDAGGWPAQSWMQQVAAEMNLSETAFAYPLQPGERTDWALRWFTPTVEVDLCGHATLATAHALAGDHPPPLTTRFHSRSGILVTRTHPDGAITLDFPAAPLTSVAIPAALSRALGSKPVATYRTGALGDVLAVFPDEATVRAVTPRFSDLEAFSRCERIRGIIATAPAADPSGGYDFVSRFFAPATGIPEDPVTGSAHTALAPYWSRRLRRMVLTGWQASPRGGRVRTEMAGDRVHLTGHAVTILEGTLRHRPA